MGQYGFAALEGWAEAEAGVDMTTSFKHESPPRALASVQISKSGPKQRLPLAVRQNSAYLDGVFMLSKSSSNRLGKEKSPYLLQHSHNPVDWFPWGKEAFDKAKTEDKPIFLSVGYSTCHWCHVMEHESFESTAIAAFLNEHFVSIKVDREERPWMSTRSI